MLTGANLATMPLLWYVTAPFNFSYYEYCCLAEIFGEMHWRRFTVVLAAFGLADEFGFEEKDKADWEWF